jgi:hypothetical protein
VMVGDGDDAGCAHPGRDLHKVGAARGLVVPARLDELSQGRRTIAAGSPKRSKKKIKRTKEKGRETGRQASTRPDSGGEVGGGVVLGQRRAFLLPAHGLDEFVQVGKVGVGLLSREQFLHVPTTRGGQPNEND